MRHALPCPALNPKPSVNLPVLWYMYDNANNDNNNDNSNNIDKNNKQNSNSNNINSKHSSYD